MSIFAGNMALLKKNYPFLYKTVCAVNFSSARIEIIDSKTSDKTVRVKIREYGHDKQVLLHSSFNPVLEGRKFAEEQMREQKKVNFLYGFGLGYHVQAMVKILAEGNKLVIADLNLDVFRIALELRDISDVLDNCQVHLFISDDLNYMATKIGGVLDESPDMHIITHVPSLTVVEEKYDELKYLLQELNLRKSIGREYIDLLHTNFLRNRQILKHNVGEFFGRFKNLPIIIVSAGPSLDKNKHLLKGLGNKALIICVAHALKALINIDIKPHFIITIDPEPITLKQIEGFEHLDIPFILMATAWPGNAEIYQGPKLIACQHPDYLNPGEENFLIKTGGSVSTAALDIAIKMGGNPIIFIGQDLAFTANKHHCEDSFHENVSLKPLDTMRRVKGWNNEDVYTTLGMVSFNRWIRSRVRNEGGTTVINATEGGAYIEGLKHMKLQEVIEQYLHQNFNVYEKIKQIISELD